MKLFNFKNIFSLIFANFLLVGFALSQTVYTDKREGADLSEYQTYNWVFEKDMIPNDQMLVSDDMVLVYNNMTARSHLKEAIETQMKARGFILDEKDPDMLVNFQILEEDTELRTYTMTNGQDYLGFGPRSVSTKMVPVKEGTVIVNFMDATTGNQLWQGFASGAFNETDMKNLSVLDAKVVSIFNDFNFDLFGE